MISRGLAAKDNGARKRCRKVVTGTIKIVWIIQSRIK